MKQKLLITLLAIIATLTFALAFAACGGGINGTYYKVKYDGTLDESLYFKLESGNWEDDDGVKGTYKTEENRIRLYVTLFGENEVLAEGTVENGVLSIDMGGGIKEIYISKDHQHEYGEWKTVSEATCTSDGIRTRTCACSVTERDVTPALGHSGEWTVAKEATCTEEGSKTYICTVCGEEDSQPISKLPHNYSTSYSYGIDKHWKYCEICGDKTDTAEHAGDNECNICGIPLVATSGLRMELNTDKSGYAVAGIGSVTGKIIRIPQTHEGLPVTSIKGGAFKYGSLNGVIIPDSVTSIGESAFEYCSSLTIATIPDSVTYIGDFAFDGCSLTSINIPNNVTSIGTATFRGCGKLTNITIPYGVTSIGGAAFSGCTSLTSITIPNSVTSIGNGAFENCSSLTNIEIPESVISIKGYAFSGCTSLKTQTENNVQYLGKWAIGCDKNATQVTLRNDTKGIVSAFTDCTSLTSIIIPNSVIFISEESFTNCSSLTDIILPNGVPSIGWGTFYNCSSLTSITIPESITDIDGLTFSNCSSLTNITFIGTIEQWNKISINTYEWNTNTGNYTIYCTDGEIAKNGTVTKY